MIGNGRLTVEQTTQLLCTPCAIKLTAMHDIRVVSPRRDKITCAECGRRRYGSEYTVTEKEGEKQ